jgi:hypothetical protein
MLDAIARLAPLTFQQLCADLLQGEHPGFRAVDGSGGDEGVDGWVPENNTYYQFHAPKLRVRKEKFVRYLTQAARHNPAKWIFITNRDFTRPQWRWFDSSAATVSFPIEVWGGTKLCEELGSHPDLVARYLPSIRIGATGAIRVGTQRARQINNISAQTVNVHTHGRRAARPRLFVSGIVANEPTKLGYLKYLAHRFNDYKERQVGKARMRPQILFTEYRRAIGYLITETPLEKFDAGREYLQERIENSMVGRIKRAKGEKLYETFEEFVAR